MTFKALTDLALSTCMNVFGSEIEYKPDNSSLTINISAVFDSNTLEVDYNAGAAVIMDEVYCNIKVSDIGQDPIIGDRVIHEYKEFRVIDYNLDHFGGAKLKLEEL